MPPTTTPRAARSPTWCPRRHSGCPTPRRRRACPVPGASSRGSAGECVQGAARRHQFRPRPFLQAGRHLVAAEVRGRRHVGRARDARRGRT
ncbi:MAG: hypothetical protein ACK56F_00835, partial [bacterium]